MLAKLLPLVPLFLLLSWAALQDVRTRRIRNWLTVSLAAGGIIASFMPGAAIVTPWQAFTGLLCGFALGFVLFALSALGGGDVKLLAAIGAWVGPIGAVAVFAVAAIAGMVIVLVQCAIERRLPALFRNSAVVAINLAHVSDVGVKHAGETARAFRSVDRPLPYAVPVLIATAIVVMVWAMR